MPTKITLVVEDNPIVALEKFMKHQNGKNRFKKVTSIVFEEIPGSSEDSMEHNSITDIYTGPTFADLKLKTKTRNALTEAYSYGKGPDGKKVERQFDMDIKTVAELACKTDAELLEYYNIGKNSVTEIRAALAEVSKPIHQLELDL